MSNLTHVPYMTPARFTMLLEDLLPGGKGDDIRASDVDAHELAMGMQVEMEHTSNRKQAREIAMDHLSEDPHYYRKLRDAGLADELKT